MALRSLLVLLLTTSVHLGCQSTRTATGPDLQSPKASRVSFTETTDAIPADPALDAIVAPYRARMQSNIEEVIGEATGEFTKGGPLPETTLGNMAADAMLHVIQQQVDSEVHIALTNNGGLRVPIAEGPITVGKMFELMPFENTTVILHLDGVQIDSLAQQIARSSAAISGMSFKIDGDTRTAFDIHVQGRPLEPGAEYRLVTSDYLANGGGSIDMLHAPVTRQEFPIFLRDLFIAYVREKGTLTPTLDGRMQVVD